MLLLTAGISQAEVSACPPGDAVGSVPLGESPRIVILHKSDLTQWHPPACAGWPADSKARLVVTLTGTFRFDGNMDDLLARVGEISRLRAIPYWSARDEKWAPLALDASALNSADPRDRRADFSASELTPGAQLYYWEDDALTGEKVNALTVYERTADQAVIGTDNVTPIRRSIFTVFEPGASRSALFLERISPGVYSATILSSAMEGSSGLVEGHADVYVNRERAIFGFLSGNTPGGPALALSSER